MLITDLAVLELDEKAGKFRLTELARGETVESIRKKTEAEFVSDGNVVQIALQSQVVPVMFIVSSRRELPR